ncbi:MAG: hypothetical protein CMP21_03550 [Rickettsiales bacterium]|nr:hypothetical protein [Rickettsiales bacterium]|tara:strand:+ start:17909 stop:18376 length:468 start_codon:yes stop_codon:yes gene_type:complete
MEYAIVTVSQKTFFSRLIQLFTWSKWNHVAFYINKYNYRGVIAEVNFNGVQFFSLKEYCKDKDVRIHKNTPNIKDLRQTLHFIFKNKNKKYDFFRTLFFFYKKKNIDDKSKWNCIEFIEEIFRDQGVELFNGEKLTPGQINKRLSSDEDLIFLRK